MGDASKSIVAPGGETIPCGKTGEPWYFLEELYPALGNLVPRDIAAREVLRVSELGLGIDGKMQVYLDMTNLPPEKLQKVDSVLKIYSKFTGEDPHKVPMKIFPAVHYSMGGAWVDWPAADDPDRQVRFRQMTNIAGCFNIGESEYQYHGANRLGANSLLSCIFGGLVAAMEIPRYFDTLNASHAALPSHLFTDALTREEVRKRELLNCDGPENVHLLHDELADWMVRNVTVKRNNADLQKTLGKIEELQKRYGRIHLDDRGTMMNQTYVFASQFGPMLNLAYVMTKGALLRNESRGAHFKPEYPKRDDEHWLKSTIASYKGGKHEIFYREVDVRHLKPIPRDYSHAKKIKPQLERIPTNIQLPL